MNEVVSIEEMKKELRRDHPVKVDGIRVSIVSDDDPPSPRDWDNVGTMACWHRRHTLGDVQPKEDPQEYYEEVIAPIVEAGGVCLPLFVYEHGGITMRTGSFPCPWDSGQVGWIYCAKEKIDEEWSGDAEHAQEYLKGEVKDYADYLEGKVYGFKVEKVLSCGECTAILDSCYGFFGSYDDADLIGEAWRAFLYHLKEERGE